MLCYDISDMFIHQTLISASLEERFWETIGYDICVGDDFYSEKQQFNYNTVFKL